MKENEIIMYESAKAIDNLNKVISEMPPASYCPSRFIRVHNAPMDADQIIESSLQIVNNLIEASEGKTLDENGALPIPDVSVLLPQCDYRHKECTNNGELVNGKWACSNHKRQ